MTYIRLIGDSTIATNPEPELYTRKKREVDRIRFEILQLGDQLDNLDERLEQRPDQTDEVSVRLQQEIANVEDRILRLDEQQQILLREMKALRVLAPRFFPIKFRRQHRGGSENRDPNRHATQSAFVFLV